MSYEAWRITYQDSEQAARAAYAEAERLRAELAAMTPGDPMDWPLPCDITVYGHPIRKGTALQTAVEQMKVLLMYEITFGPIRLTPGVIAVANERWRQINAEGWTPEHDTQHTEGSLTMAAICYAEWNHFEHPNGDGDGYIPINWPWSANWWKPTTHRRNLEKAGALIAAELDLLIRKESNT